MSGRNIVSISNGQTHRATSRQNQFKLWKEDKKCKLNERCEKSNRRKQKPAELLLQSLIGVVEDKLMLG